MSVGITSPEGLAPEDVQIVDARTWAEFYVGHIPGAVHIGWEEWCQPAPIPASPPLHERGYWGALRFESEEWYRNRLEASGLDRDRPIIVYAGGPRSRGREGRIAWMLLYAGASNVLLLDGGWMGWLARNGAVQHGYRQPDPGHFAVQFVECRRRTLKQILDRGLDSREHCLVDTRSDAEFAGASESYQPRRGHIPGAVLVPFLCLFGADGQYVDADAYTALLPDMVTHAREIIAYCEVGVRAALFALLHEALTGQTVAVYDGSFMEWSLEPTLTVQVQ